MDVYRTLDWVIISSAITTKGINKMSNRGCSMIHSPWSAFIMNGPMHDGLKLKLMSWITGQALSARPGTEHLFLKFWLINFSISKGNWISISYKKFSYQMNSKWRRNGRNETNPALMLVKEVCGLVLSIYCLSMTYYSTSVWNLHKRLFDFHKDQRKKGNKTKPKLHKKYFAFEIPTLQKLNKD